MIIYIQVMGMLVSSLTCLACFESGTPGWLSGWASAFGSGHDPRFRDQIPHWAPCKEPASPSAMCLPLSVCLSWIDKNKILKNNQTMFWVRCEDWATIYKYMYYLINKKVSDLSQSKVTTIHILIILNYAIPCFVSYWVACLKLHITFQLCWQGRHFIAIL